MEFDAESKFAKIQNSCPVGCVCVCVWGGGVMEFAAKSKFAKIQNSYVWVGVGVMEFDA